MFSAFSTSHTTAINSFPTHPICLASILFKRSPICLYLSHVLNTQFNVNPILSIYRKCTRVHVRQTILSNVSLGWRARCLIRWSHVSIIYLLLRSIIVCRQKQKKNESVTFAMLNWVVLLCVINTNELDIEKILSAVSPGSQMMVVSLISVHKGRLLFDFSHQFTVYNYNQSNGWNQLHQINFKILYCIHLNWLKTEKSRHYVSRFQNFPQMQNSIDGENTTIQLIATMIDWRNHKQ